MPRLEFEYKNFIKEVTRDTGDMLCQFESHSYAIEIKVESATNLGKFAGMTLGEALQKDVGKLSRLDAKQFTVTGSSDYTGQPISFTPTLHRWFVLIAWSPASIKKIKLNPSGFDSMICPENRSILFALKVV